jgi:acyl-coenzyme A synthetase/AMP-(fatty) acid ligase
VPGQLHIGGIGLARGYWRDAHKTHRSFIHHKASGQRLYRTGDWGRYLPDGNIEFLGREDLQVKIQGNRIELGEIEAKLAEHPQIAHAVVVVREDAAGEKSLAGYIVTRSRKALQESVVREFLLTKLPDHMVPSTFVFVERFPLTANGKVNRKALLQMAPPAAVEPN